MIKIAFQKLQKYSRTGFYLALPTVFTNDLKLNHTSDVNVYRTIIDGNDCLVISKNELNTNANILRFPAAVNNQ